MKEQPQNVLITCKPRDEVLEGELEDAIFAADFRHVINNTAPQVYQNPEIFFRNTEPTPNLKQICSFVFSSLANKTEGGQLIRLSTGYGGGKSHTLITLWHLAHNLTEIKFTKDFILKGELPSNVKVVAIDAAEAGIPVFIHHSKIKVRSIQGEIFWQLGGATALKSLGEADNHEASPDEGQVSEILGSGPLLLLLDELVIYMAKLSPAGQGNFLGFLGQLISAVQKRPQTVLVITDPGSQPAYANISQQLKDAIGSSAIKLDDIFSRKMSDYDPIGKQAARVIIRRLFQQIDPEAAKKCALNYHQLYLRVFEGSSKLLPPEAVKEDYQKRIEECYPFHPRLIDSAKERLGPLPDFQRSRGVLRLFARIIRDIWDQQQPIDIITAGDIDWNSERIRGDLLHRLKREQFSAAIDADIEGHARQLDGHEKNGIHYRVASALLLESLPQQDKSGLDASELTLAILRTDEAGTEPSEALDRLISACWHTYPMQGAAGYQFQFEPNVIKQIEQRSVYVDVQEARDRVFTEVQTYFAGPDFKLSNWPEKPRDVLELKDLQLVLCKDTHLAEEICKYADTTDPNAPIPRRFRNSIVAITPSADSYQAAIEKAQKIIAAETVERDAKKGEKGDRHALIRDQMNRYKPRIEREFKIQTRRAFDTVIRAEGTVGKLEERYQVSDEEILRSAHGQKCLKAFLQDKDMIYPSGSALDPDRFIRNILAGTTPIPDQPDTYRLSDVHERFLSAPGLRLISDASIVRQTVLKAVEQGKAVIKFEDDSVYDNNGKVEGPSGSRRRINGARPPTIHLQSNELISRADSTNARVWLAVDDTPPSTREQPIQPYSTRLGETSVIANSWEDITKYAETRPLLNLSLDAANPSVASNLIGIGQPLGADKITLNVTVSGDLKTGGSVGFTSEDVSLNASIKPLESAQMLYNAMKDRPQYGATLKLIFNEPGRQGLKSLLEQAAEKSSDEIEISATFGKQGGS